MLLATLPVAFLILITLGFYKHYDAGWRDSLLRAAVTSGVTVTLVVEILGALRLLGRPALALSWALLCLLAALWTLRTSSAEVTQSPRPARNTPPKPEIFWPLLSGSLLLVGSVALAALLAPPGPFDVHAYHMPRVLFWLQQRSVDHYPTPYHQELFLPPWAEFATLTVYALAGSDRFVNLVHFVFYIGSALAVSSVARLIGASVTAQTASALFLLTLPQAVLLASGSKNDLTVTFWIVSAVYFALLYSKTPNRSDNIFLAFACALAILTKGTAYVWLPAAVFLALASRGRHSLVHLARCLPTIVAASVVLNAGHYARNFQVFQTPWGCDAPFCGTPYKFTNAEISPPAAFASLVRHLVSHATTPLPQVNQAAFEIATSLIRLLGVDPQDSGAIWFGTRFGPGQFRLHEFAIGNPLHLALIIGSLVFMVRQPSRCPPGSRLLIVAAGLGFLAFCWVFRWQPWGSRLHLPMFALAAPVVGAALDSLHWRSVSAAAGVVLLMLAFPVALANEVRPLATTEGNLFSVPRDRLYPHAEDVAALTRTLEQAACSRLALDVQHPFQIYPLLRGVRMGSPHVEVAYLTTDSRFERRYSGKPLQPCAVVYNSCDDPGRAIQCRALGEPQRFGSLWLITGFDAQWTPAKRWEVRQPGVVSFLGQADAVRIPVILRAENTADLKRLQGAASDKWVNAAGLVILVALEEKKLINVRLRGDVPPGSPVLPQAIRLVCGGGAAHRQVIEKEGTFEFAVTLECPAEQVTRLSVWPERTFRPLDIGINQDPRHLAFRIFELEIVGADR